MQNIQVVDYHCLSIVRFVVWMFLDKIFVLSPLSLLFGNSRVAGCARRVGILNGEVGGLVQRNFSYYYASVEFLQ